MSPQLAGGDSRYRQDRGDEDPCVAGALAAFGAGTGTEHAALTALARARLLVPIVAAAGPGGEKASDMAAPAIVGHDGRSALPAFTSLANLQRWRPDARPVPVPAKSVWQSAVQQSQAVIIDIAGPLPLAVEGARLTALASGRPVPLMHEDPDVQAAVAAVAAGQPPGLRVRLGPAQGAADFTLEVAAADAGQTEPVPAAAATVIANEVAARLAGRLGQGIAVLVRAPRAAS